MIPDVLNLFLLPVQEWFRTALGEPTPAQREGWPAIAAGQHTLILAPTGSGKTLAAFLACLDALWRQETLAPGIRLLYVSPLKALNNDIYRNLQVPLEGVAEIAARNHFPLPKIEVAVRTGDTPAAERQRLLRRPPHVLITTPESLHLLLTSRARETLRGVRHCIVDEIHALCPNKRGVFLSLLLERLEALNPQGFVRIGLSATQRPLDEVARYLGGFVDNSSSGEPKPRPVTVVDAGLRKGLDLRVVSPVEQFGPLPEKSIWPSIYRLLGNEIRRHRSTIVFANNRRSVERITANLNDEGSGIGDQGFGMDEEGLDFSKEGSGIREKYPSVVHQVSNPQSLIPNPQSPIPNSPLPLARAHHGSVALEVRQETERALKEGRLRAVVATASLELGIDMGAVDLVCQVESPGNVARGLQRVGRAGHLVGRDSKGLLIPKTLPDLLEQAVLAREMVQGNVEEIHVPVNCLDVLAQQIVAMVAMEDWEVPALYALVRRAYPFRELTPQALDAVLEMASGRYQFGLLDQKGGAETVPIPARPAALHPRISWDRVHNRLLALPGSQHLALVNGGTIPDTGQYAVYTLNGVRIGELDEEFIYERRVGDTFLLGTTPWRLERIEADRVLVAPATGAPAMVPFWRGEQTGRSFDLGRAMGCFLRELAGRLDKEDCLPWLQREYHLDPTAASNLRYHVRRQLQRTGCLPTDRTLVIEASRDPLGDWQVLVLSPLGSRLHFSLRLALENVLRQRLGYRPQCLHHDDGILIRLADSDEPLWDVLEGLAPDNVKGLILDELADSALFALRFRQNAARALLLPRAGAGRRAPLWLQRLRGRDLLQMARRQSDFPIVAETFRECLHDHLDLPRLEQFLADIRGGEVEVVTRRLETPSPFASSLLFAFTAAYMYQFDGTESEPSGARLDRDLLDQLMGTKGKKPLLDARAVHQVERRLRGLGQLPRTATEMAEWLRRLGDLTYDDLEGPMPGFLQKLEAAGRVKRIELPGCRKPLRWVLTEEAQLYETVFGPSPSSAEEKQADGELILKRFLETHALVGLHDILDRYPFESGWAQRQLEDWARQGRLVPIQAEKEVEPVQWSVPANFEQVQRGTLAILRREVVTCPAWQFADFVMHWQGLYQGAGVASPFFPVKDDPGEMLAEVLGRLQALLLPAELWEQAVLPGRVPGYQPHRLDELIGSGEWTWWCRGTAEQEAGNLAFVTREDLARLPLPTAPDNLDSAAEQVLEHLRQRGALFAGDLARETGKPPSAVRAALWNLLRHGLVSNDGFDVIRKGQEVPAPSAEGILAETGRPFRRSSLMRARHRRPGIRRPEGRWALLPWTRSEVEAQAFFLASVLLQRYGVAARELALLDELMPPWRVLYEVLSRLELAGKVRRGYFVEGLSGAQFALPEAARLLQDLSLPSTAAAPVLLVHSLDPANLYGSGAPLDIPLLEGDSRPLTRRPGNWLVLRAGRPILLIEQQGKRLTSLPGAGPADLAAAVARLPHILDHDKGLAARRKITVEEWNGRPVTGSDGRELLETAGFVRDYQSMTLYGAWR